MLDAVNSGPSLSSFPWVCRFQRDPGRGDGVCLFTQSRSGKAASERIQILFLKFTAVWIKASCCCFLAGKPLAQCCVSKCVTADSGSRHRAKPWLVKSADFPGVNTLPMADVRLLRWSRWAHSWAEPCAASYLQQAGAKAAHHSRCLSAHWG